MENEWTRMRNKKIIQKAKVKIQSASWRAEFCVKCLKCMRRLKRKNIKRLKRFKPQTFQASSFKADPDFRQDDSQDHRHSELDSESALKKLKRRS